jgi:hypothetical protein
MSATEASTDRRADVASLGILGTLAAALDACAAALDPSAPEVSRVWAAAGRTLGRYPTFAEADASEASVWLWEADTDPLAPPWLVLDGLIALIVEHLAIDAPPSSVVALERSLEGLRRLSNALRPWGQGFR